MQKYIKLSKGFINSSLIKEEDVYKSISDINSEWYTSMYYYTEEHYKKVQEEKDKTGAFSVAGIRDVTTNKLWWDFDSKDIEKAQKDTISLVKKLQDNGYISSNIQLFFSGSKGFHVIVETNDTFKRNQVESICRKLAEGLSTFDTSVYDEGQILRVPGTLNKKGNLFKTPLSDEDLFNFSVQEIKDLSKDSKFTEINKWLNYWEVTSTPESLLKFSNEKVTHSDVIVTDIDFTKKPKFLSNCRWAIQKGLVDEGKRNSAYLMLAATYKNFGYDENETYRNVKSALENRKKRKGLDYDKKVLWNEIIRSVYSNGWENGQGSCKTPGNWLYDYCQSLGDNKCKHEDEEKIFINFNEFTNTFNKFATEIEKNKIVTGLQPLDKNVLLCTSTLVGLLGSPGCHAKGTKILMFDGTLKNVEDIIVGDKLMGDDSTPRNVLKLIQGKDDLFTVKQKNGNDYVVNKDHILCLKGSLNSTNKKPNIYSYGNIDEISVHEYLQQNDTYKKYVKGYKVGADFCEKETLLHPYFLGYWLGNGTSEKPQLTLHKKDTDIVNWIDQYTKTLNCSINILENSKNSITLNIKGYKQKNNLLNFLRNENLLGNKHIPSNYLINSREKRLQLLAGLIDSDGYYDNLKDNYEITFKDDKLSEDLLYLCRSLGFKCTKTIEKKGCWYKGEYKDGYYSRIIIVGDNLNQIPNILNRKKSLNLEKQRWNDLTEIEIVPFEYGEYFGFNLDGNNRYLLSDFTVTHNSGKTTFALNLLNRAGKNGLNPIFYSMDMGIPLVYLKLIQKYTGYQPERVFEIFKNDKEETERLIQIVKDEFGDVKFSFKSGLNTQNIRSGILSHQQETGNKVKLVVVDYLECIAGPYSDSTANTAIIANELKDVANETETCILLLLQTQKHAAAPDEPLTSMRNIKGSSVIEQACSVILTIWREGYSVKYNGYDNFISIASVKNRLNNLWCGDFHWNGVKGEIRELTDDEEMELSSFKEKKKQDKASEQNSNGFNL